MSAATITDPAQLEAAYARAEQLAQEAAEAEYTAFVTGQDAYGAYEVACDDAARPPGELRVGPGPVAVAPGRWGLEPRPAGRRAPPIKTNNRSCDEPTAGRGRLPESRRLDRHGDQSAAAAAVRLGASAVVVVSREYRALGRELRPGPQIKRRPVWARLVGWVLRHLPEIQLVALLIRVSQLTAAQIGPLWTNTGTPDHGMSVYFGRRRYSAAPLPAVAIESEDLHGAGPVLEVRGVQ